MKVSFQLLISIILLLPGLLMRAQEQTAAVPFLTFPADARTAGMGMTGTAMPGQSFAIFRNAATVMFSQEKMYFGCSYAPWNREICDGSRLYAIGGSCHLRSNQAVLAGFRHFTHGKIPVTDEKNDFIKNFQAKDWALDLGYSRRLNDRLSLALTFRYIRSDLGSFGGADAASAFAFDFGACYGSRLCEDRAESFWSVGLQIANIGSKVKYLTAGYDLPACVRLGGSLCYPFSDKHKLTGNLDLGCAEMMSDTRSFEWCLGAEYGFLGHGFVRAGYYGGDQERNSGNYATLGCGAACCHIRADFSYLLASSDSPLKNTWQLSLSVGLNKR